MLSKYCSTIVKMMLSIFVVVSIITYCSAAEYGSPQFRPQYRFPIQHRPEAQYEAISSPYESPDDAAKYAPFSHYGVPPNSAAPQYKLPPQYREPPPQYGGSPQQRNPAPYTDDYASKYDAPPQERPPSQYEPATTDDYNAGLRPDQVPLNPSAGVHDGGADIPGMGFVKGYPFTQLFSDQEGYDIPGLGFIAGYPFTQVDSHKDAYDIPGLGLVPGYPFTYIGAYTPKSDPQEDGYGTSDDYMQAVHDDSYSPKTMDAPAGYKPAPHIVNYSPQAVASSPADYAPPKTVQLQRYPSAHTEYLSQPLYASAPYPQDASSDSYAAKDYDAPPEKGYAFHQVAYPGPTQNIRLRPQVYIQQSSPDEYAQPSPDEYAQAAPAGYARHPALNHIRPYVHLPKFIMNPPTAPKGSPGPQYH